MDQPAASTLNAFLEAYCLRFPVNASFLGVHDYDDRLPDFGENGIAETIDEMKTLRAGLRGNSIDEQLARSFVTIQIEEYSGDHFHRANPALYTGEAIWGILTSPQRLNAVPRLLSQARQNVRAAPIEWTKRAIRECRAAITILERIPESADAMKAFQEFDGYLNREVLQHPHSEYGCGSEFFDLLMKEGHRMRESAEEFLRFAEEEFRRHRNAQAPADQPTVYDLSRHQSCWDECRQLVVSRELLTWPDFPLIFTRPPDLVRDAAQDLYYLAYRAPAAFHPPLPHRCEVNPCGPITLKLNHVVHHAGTGHHVQNYYAYRSVSLIGKIAAVDCASRIAMFCGGTMAEGWACYATDLTEECESVDIFGKATVRLAVSKFDFVVNVDGEAKPRTSRLGDAVGHADKLTIRFKQDRKGTTSQRQVDYGGVPNDMHETMKHFAEQIVQSLDAVAVPIPDAEFQVEPGQTWQAQRLVPLETPEASVLGLVDMTYTYRGVRPFSKGDLSVVDLSGTLGDRQARSTGLTGESRGAAQIDSATGRVLKAQAVLDATLELSFRGHSAKSSVKLEVRLKRGE